MTETRQFMETLKRSNPFISSSTGDPWLNRYPDVEFINMKAYTLINSLIEQKRSDPSNNFACLVLGEPGSGKTHLISRLARRFSKFGGSYLLSYIQPIEDPGQPFRYLLREVMTSLCRPLDQERTISQLDILISSFFREILQKKVKVRGLPKAQHKMLIQGLETDPRFYTRSVLLKRILSKDTFERLGREYFQSRFIDFDDECLHVLFQLGKPEVRSVAVSWLKGTVIDEMDSDQLKTMSRVDLTPAAREAGARSILFSISQLLAHYGLVLAVCFDRLENLLHQEQVMAFGKMVEFLVDHAQSMLPIAFFRGQLWEEQFSQTLNSHVVSRLESNAVVLAGCNVEQALDLVKSRLNPENRDGDNSFYPFRREELVECFKSRLRSPREVIIEVNGLLQEKLGIETGPVAENPADILHSIFLTEKKKALKELDDIAIDRFRLRHTLDLYLRSIPPDAGLRVESYQLSKDESDRIDCRCKIHLDRDQEAAILVDDAPHHKAVNAKLKRGLDLLIEQPEMLVFYLRESRARFPGEDVWKETHKTLKQFKQNGGTMIRLNKDQSAAWYALTMLHYKVVDREVTLTEPPDRLRPVTEEEFIRYVSQVLHDRKLNLFSAMNEYMKTPRSNLVRKKRLNKLDVLTLK